MYDIAIDSFRTSDQVQAVADTVMLLVSLPGLNYLMGLAFDPVRPQVSKYARP